ncbi:cell division protein FtsL [Heyndrickxia sporothermodurans]|uniref:cell division protein FtsL n=1 Tax=Heyndrickxia TaxID=2837504 RepID=UPI000D3BF63A|nr:cell division protein FtsL [Heyndrickxia sporothermodurans]PTY79895.1 cell division protein FtsL [Heyndrickxia sporothermodurans]
MSNLARKQQQPYIQPKIHTEPKIQPIHRRSQITLGEKLLAALVIAFVCIMAIKVIATQAAIYKVNKEIHQMEASVQTKKKVNEDLKMQVSDLSKYERIREIAKKQGLKMNDKNIKVVEGQ